MTEDLIFRDQTQGIKAKAAVSRLLLRNNDFARQMSLATDPGTVRDLQIAWDVLARHDFFANYVMGLSKSYDTLITLYVKADPGGHLAASVDAACLALLAIRQLVPAKTVMQMASERYVAALRLVNQALTRPSSARADETLQSILLLDLYEKLTHRNSSSTVSWMRHMNGAIALLRIRGSRNLQTCIGRRLARRLFITLVISCAIAGIRVPRELDQLKWGLDRYYQKDNDPQWSVTTLNIQAFDFLADIRNRRLSCGHDIIARATRLDRMFLALEDSLPLSWYPKRLFVGEDSVQRQFTLGGHYDIYESVFCTQVRNVIRISRLHLHLVIERQALSQEITNLTIAAESRKMVESFAGKICASATQYVVPFATVENAIPFSPSQQLRCHALLSPLYLAAYASKDFELRAWALNLFRYMSDVGGLGMAQKTADVLMQCPNESFWNVYAMLGGYAIAA